MDQQSFQINPIKAKDTIPLRHRILRPNQAWEDCIYQGDIHEHTLHLGAFNQENVLISIASFFKQRHFDLDSNHCFRLRGMATDPDYRNRGLATKLLLEAHHLLGLQGVEKIWCNARESAFSFYEKIGYSQYGDFFEIEGIGTHKVMYISL